ncbi:hypothetical protein GH714_042454 [Hevea brasiliensis]|uniref:3'-5' exonuclease domain-containing protein n=1 Tax=Hevea brasiliensis TaxID=3981 RepID=A0A6A6M4W6_HEVBR|nr:hypothetical protein GH714_042454 [Hevea brasiliensis]
MGDDDEALSVAELASGHEDASKVTKKHFKDISYDCFGSETSCSQQLVVYIDSKNDRDLLMNCISYSSSRILVLKVGGKLVKQKGRDDFKAAIGFLHVIDLLSSAQRLIVGHNCILDIAHIYSKFLGPRPLTAGEFSSSINTYFLLHKDIAHIYSKFLGPRPLTAGEFSSSINTYFPLDTKVLLNANNVLLPRMKKSSTSLSSAFSLLCAQIAVNSNKNSDWAFVHVRMWRFRWMIREQAGTIGIRWKTKLVVSKSEAQSQQQESFSEENAATITSVSSEQVKFMSTLLFGDNQEFESLLAEELQGFMASLRQIESGHELSSPASRIPLLFLMGDDDEALSMAELASGHDDAPKVDHRIHRKARGGDNGRIGNAVCSLLG